MEAFRVSWQAVCRGMAAFVLFAVLAGNIGVAHAAPLKGFEALAVTVTGGGKIVLKPGESKLVTLEFQNIGTTTWTNNGADFVSVYTYSPKYRTSVFQDGWYKTDQPAKLTEASVAPKGVGHISFKLKAPAQTGTYQETFALAAEDVAWIPGGQTTFNIVVTNDASTVLTTPTSTPSSSPTTPSTSSDADTGLSGLVLLRSAKNITAEGGETINYTVGIKNTGTKSWKTRQVRVPELAIATVGSETQHSSWLSSSVLVAKADTEVSPGSLDFISFSFRAPLTKGSHVVKYSFAADDTVVPDLTIDIPVEVTSNAPDAYQSPRRTDTPVIEDTGDYIEEPMLRVGVLIVDDETDWEVQVSCEKSWKLRETTGNLLGEFDGGESVTAFYNDSKSKYYFNRGNGLEVTSYPIRFIPDEENSICTVENFDRRVTRNHSHPDNTFRNILELRYNDTKERTWLINELRMEYYLRGLAETSNVSHQEFQKALIVVARTYALYHFERGTKRGPEGFHVTAYSDDQVYNGYGQEMRAPRLTESVEATRGRVVTYDGETAITPYFSRSDGRTRSWGEVWYGDVPWLIGVPAPCDKGKTLWGHGVGMSASEALCQANNGKKWDEIIQYFYTGVEVDKHWK